MKRAIITIFVAILLLSTLSAEMILKEDPKELYNYGDVVTVPVKVLATKNMQGFLSMNLICAGEEYEMFREYITLSTGQEKSVAPSIPLLKSLIPRPSVCVLKITYLDEYISSEEFSISNQITVSILEGKTAFKPGEALEIEGNAIKDNGAKVEGFIEAVLTIDGTNESFELSDTVKKGYFYINTTLPEDTKAGSYFVSININEKEDGVISNQGLTNYQISIDQVPTSVEVFFENNQVEPGTKLNVKAILHDQTGEKIASTAILTIKDKDEKIMFQEEKATDEPVEYNIPSDYPASEWEVVAVSNRMTGVGTFEILEKKAINTTILNGTLLVKNKGNVLYNDSLAVKIGNETIYLNLSLDIGEEETYDLEAPEGEYEVQVQSGEYSYSASGVMLTGRAIDISRPGSVGEILTHPFVWIFIIVILALGAYFIFKRGYNKTFVAYIKSHKKTSGKKLEEETKREFLDIKNPATQSPSMTGEKHTSSIICLRVKELPNIKKKFEVQRNMPTEGTAINALQNAVNLAQAKKAFVNVTNDCILFILSPLVKRTFKNEKEALVIAQDITRILEGYNKLAKEKITFGVSVSNGELVEAKKGNSLEFMTMGNLIPQCKKLASVKGKGVILSDNIISKLSKEVKTQKHNAENLTFYSIKEFKNSEENEKFLKRFVASLEEDKKTQTTKQVNKQPTQDVQEKKE